MLTAGRRKTIAEIGEGYTGNWPAVWISKAESLLSPESRPDDHKRMRTILRNVRDRLHNVVAPPGNRSWRPQWLPTRLPLHKESDVHPHSLSEKADLFLSYNTGSTEIETLNWIHATILLLKPMHLLETGAADGLGTIAMASACKDNGFGMVHSIELDTELCRKSEKQLARLGLSEFVTVHNKSSLDYLFDTNTCFDLSFFDSLCEIRWKEFELAFQRNLLSNVAIFHDTSESRTQTAPHWPDESLHSEYRKKLRAFSQFPGVCGFWESPLSRGLVTLVLNKKSSFAPLTSNSNRA